MRPLNRAVGTRGQPPDFGRSFNPKTSFKKSMVNPIPIGERGKFVPIKFLITLLGLSDLPTALISNGWSSVCLSANSLHSKRPKIELKFMLALNKFSTVIRFWIFSGMHSISFSEKQSGFTTMETGLLSGKTNSVEWWLSKVYKLLVVFVVIYEIWKNNPL